MSKRPGRGCSGPTGIFPFGLAGQPIERCFQTLIQGSNKSLALFPRNNGQAQIWMGIYGSTGWQWCLFAEDGCGQFPANEKDVVAEIKVLDGRFADGAILTTEKDHGRQPENDFRFTVVRGWWSIGQASRIQILIMSRSSILKSNRYRE